MAGWAPLGALGPYGARALAVSPAWPADKTIVAVRGPDVIASPDGGAHWERLGVAPVPRHINLTFANPHVLLATTDEELFRSTDLGHTWPSTLVASRASLQVSPATATTFALVGQGTLRRSRDAAQSWQVLQPAEGQFVQSVRLSPDFALDHTVVAAVAGGMRFSAGSPASGHVQDLSLCRCRRDVD